jgi:hypothetical protein
MPNTYTNATLDDAYNRGRQAFRDGQTRDKNPFELTVEIDLRREEWFRGWYAEKLVQDLSDNEQS